MSRVMTGEEYMESAKNGVTDFTKNGKCSNCGECCGDTLPLSDTDIRILRAFLATHDVDEEIHVPLLMTPVIDKMCPFRDDLNKRCKVYSTRPTICRIFRCNKESVDIAKELLENMYTSKEEFRVYSMRKLFFNKET